MKKKTFRKKFINKSEYIRNKQDNFQIPYWYIEIYVDSYANDTFNYFFIFVRKTIRAIFSFPFLIIEISFEITSKRVTMLSNKE